MLGQLREYIASIFPRDAKHDHHGTRRLECWWEPIFNPQLHGKLERGSWLFDDSAGPSKKFLLGESLVEATSKGVLHEVKSITFMDCDFQGRFDPETIVMFDDCRFIRCDFAYSYWKDTHFRECLFEGCSFSLASFDRCQFRDNEWRQLGFSGSKTDLKDCHITNPADFIDAGFSDTRPNDNRRKHSWYQWYRLQGTKAHLARTLLASHETTGDDSTFYETARVHDLQQSWSVIARNFYNLGFKHEFGRIRAFFGLLFGLLENGLLRFFGLINGWGASILRPLVSLVILSLIFGVAYEFIFDFDRFSAFQKSFNITTLIGYSNEYSEGISRTLKASQSIHASISIVIYTVFFGTVISKLSRVR